MAPAISPRPMAETDTIDSSGSLPQADICVLLAEELRDAVLRMRQRYQDRWSRELVEIAAQDVSSIFVALANHLDLCRQERCAAYQERDAQAGSA